MNRYPLHFSENLMELGIPQEEIVSGNDHGSMDIGNVSFAVLRSILTFVLWMKFIPSTPSNSVIWLLQERAPGRHDSRCKSTCYNSLRCANAAENCCNRSELSLQLNHSLNLSFSTDVNQEVSPETRIYVAENTLSFILNTYIQALTWRMLVK